MLRQRKSRYVNQNDAIIFMLECRQTIENVPGGGAAPPPPPPAIAHSKTNRTKTERTKRTDSGRFVIVATCLLGESLIK